MLTATTADELREQVRRRYAESARAVTSGGGGSYVGCIAGALSKSEYEEGLRAAGFDEVDVVFTHEVADGMHGAIVKAPKPREPKARGLPVVQPAAPAGCC